MIHGRKAKIVGKIADNRSETDFLTMLFETGVDVAWLNTAHQDEDATMGVIERIKAVRPDLPILIDTKGPEVRTRNVETPIEIVAGDHIVFTGDATYTGDHVVQVSYEKFHAEVPVGNEVLYDDATVTFIVEEILPNGIKCVSKNNGLIKNKKSLNVPGVHIQLPALSEKDISFMHFCARHNIDFIIHSFVRNVNDLNEIKAITSQYPDYAGKILAKIENREGFDNVADILDNCDGLMVARGDLGAEVPLWELPYMQKKMVELANKKGKYSIVATQVLDSMVNNPRPTRAEVTDCANAILDGSGAISMSGETAYGNFPKEAVTMMAKIMVETENRKAELVHSEFLPEGGAIFAKAKEIVAAANEKSAKAIVMPNADVALAKAIAAYRPDMIVVPTFAREEDMRDVMMAYAVRPVASGASAAEIAAKTDGYLTAGDTVVTVSGAGEAATFAVETI